MLVVLVSFFFCKKYIRIVNHHLQSRWLEEEAQRAIFQGLTA